MEVIRADLDRHGIRDLNNVQAMILFNIGTDELTVGELTNRGYYLGSNVSYNVKKMVENGYLQQERSPHDRRAVNVRVSPKGLEVCERLNAMYERHANELSKGVANPDELQGMNALLAVWSGSGPRAWITRSVPPARSITQPETPLGEGAFREMRCGGAARHFS